MIIVSAARSCSYDDQFLHYQNEIQEIQEAGKMNRSEIKSTVLDYFFQDERD